MKRQVYNPYLPLWEYIPDGEPRVFGDRLYIFGSHDRAGGKSFCVNDYVAWSCPVDDLSDWRYEGVIFRKDQTPWNTHQIKPQSSGLLQKLINTVLSGPPEVGADGVTREVYYAPDVICGPDGKYYLYYFVANSSIISVAVCDTPAGKYEYLGDVRMPDGRVYGTDPADWFTFDPGVLVDDDGRVYLYTGSGQTSNGAYGHEIKGCFVMELDPADMRTVIQGPVIVLPADWDMNKPSFFEGPSIRKINGLYYLVCPTSDQTGMNYFTAKNPMGPFTHQGRIHSTSEIGYQGRTMSEMVYPGGNNHGGLVCVKGQWYIFDHRMTHGSMFSRQGVAEPVTIHEDGTIDPVGVTSCGLNGGPLSGIGTYPAAICCVLYGPGIMGKINPMIGNPKVVQDGPDYNPQEPSLVGHDITVETETAAPESYVTDIKNGSVIGWRYFDMTETAGVEFEVRGAKAQGRLLILSSPGGKTVTEIPIAGAKDWTAVSAAIDPKFMVSAAVPGGEEVSVERMPLYARFEGKGVLQIRTLTLK